MNPRAIIARHEISEDISADGKTKTIRKSLRVFHSTHPRFVAGSHFDYGYLDIALNEGYVVTILPL